MPARLVPKEAFRCAQAQLEHIREVTTGLLENHRLRVDEILDVKAEPPSLRKQMQRDLYRDIYSPMKDDRDVFSDIYSPTKGDGIAVSPQALATIGRFNMTDEEKAMDVVEQFNAELDEQRAQHQKQLQELAKQRAKLMLTDRGDVEFMPQDSGGQRGRGHRVFPAVLGIPTNGEA